MRKYTYTTFALCAACMIAASAVNVSADEAKDKLATAGILASLEQINNGNKTVQKKYGSSTCRRQAFRYK